ncbi:ATP-binding cassette domain-containing protein [Streptomyces sp. NPDC056600]|uniref:ATP-binding cassette domain-containing protein n=1 Tax=Streptomyces sp. NPDC056600 TaxID=3345874 RepID=UPI0036CB7F17
MTRDDDKTPAPAVSVRGLTKRYGETRALDGVDLDVREGTVLGVLGPNGAGKTTLVRILSTLIVPNEGRATVAGIDVLRQPRRVRRVIGLTGQYASVDEKLSGRENLYLIGRLLDLPSKAARARADELLERFSLTDAARRPASTYSGGMRRRLDLAASMIGRPQVLFLDEPTTGLDPRTRNEVWDEVKRMVGEGVTVLLTTQYMEEAEQLAGELAVMDRGRVVAGGGIDELKAKVGGRSLRIRPAARADLQPLAATLDGLGVTGLATVAVDAESGSVRVPVLSDEQLTTVLAAASSAGIALASVVTELPSLDEVFLSLTGHKASDTSSGTDAADAQAGEGSDPKLEEAAV